MRLVLPTALSALLAACSGGNEANNQSATTPANAAANNNAAAPVSRDDPAAVVTSAYLPAPGNHVARAMRLAPPPEAVALRERMTAAVMRNRAWYDSYAAQHAQGELPWHANLGISEAEYRRYLALTRQIGLSEIGPVTFTVTERPDRRLAVAAGGPAAALNGAIIDLDRGRMETPLGPVTISRSAGNDAAGSPLGRWQGVQWSNRGTGASRQLALSFGRRAQGDMLIFYDYGPTDAETVILLYPAAGPRAAAR